MKLDLAHILRLVIPFFLLVIWWAGRRWDWREKTKLWLLFVAACLALFAHAEWLHFDKRRDSIQNREFYHYYIGSKYFQENGYYDMYNATALADYEDDRKGFVPRLLVRDLRDHTKIHYRISLIKRHADVKKRFTPARWKEFKSDIAWFRKTYREGWRRTYLFHDHGYNGSPVLHLLLGGIANHIPLSIGAAFKLLSYADLFLIVLAAMALWWLIDPRVALLFVCFFGMNPFNETAFIGGAYLRYLDLLAMVFCLAFLRREWFAWAGVCCSLAISIRVFEVVWLLPLFLVLVFHWREEAFRQRAWRFARGAAIAGGLLLVVTSVTLPSTSWNPWADFAKRLQVIRAKDSLNTMSLRNVFHYSDTVKRHNWIPETKRILHERRWTMRALQLLFCLLLLLFCRRCGWSEAFFAGICLTYLFFPLSHYYYYVLALVPLLFRKQVFSNALIAMCLACACVRLFFGTSFLSFHLQSVVLVAYLLGTVVLYIKIMEPDAPADAPPSPAAT